MRCFTLLSVSTVGTPGDKALKPPAEQVKFVEDMSFGEANVAHAVPAGLANMGNTCYANATLQVLRAVPELKQALNK